MASTGRIALPELPAARDFAAFVPALSRVRLHALCTSFVCQPLLACVHMACMCWVSACIRQLPVLPLCLCSCPQPQDSYGLEKLATEELCMHYNKDFGIECRIARFHNIYGPYGTWKGGREKAPAAFCRKVRTSGALWTGCALAVSVACSADGCCVCGHAACSRLIAHSLEPDRVCTRHPAAVY